MRPKFVFGLVLVSFLILTFAFLLKRQPDGKKTETVALTSSSSIPAEPEKISPLKTAVETIPPVSSALPELTDEQISAETERLYQWSMNDDPASLSNILADLASPNKEIRDAAIDAAEEFGSTNAIPFLKAAAMNTDDTEEQIALLQAAQFLAVPPMDDDGQSIPLTPERIAAERQKQAARQARLQAPYNASPSDQPPSDSANQTPNQSGD